MHCAPWYVTKNLIEIRLIKRHQQSEAVTLIKENNNEAFKLQ